MLKRLLLFFSMIFLATAGNNVDAAQSKVNAQQDAVVGEQIEGVANPSPTQQLAARAQRLAAEQLQKKAKADKEQEEQHKLEQAAGPQEGQPDVQPRVDPLPVVNNEEVQLEGASAEDRAVAFTSEVPDYLNPGPWDAFSGNDNEGIAVEAFEELRKRQHGSGHSLILVRVFDTNRPYYYEANVFHSMLNNGGRLLNPQEPRTDLRTLARDNQIHYFECKVATRKLTYKCSYHALIADIRRNGNKGKLSASFLEHGYNMPNVAALEAPAPAAEPVVRPFAPIPREMRNDVLRVMARWLIPMSAGLIHGLINNYLARPGKENWNCFSRALPFREKVTGVIFVPLYHLMGKYLWPEYAWDPLQGNLFYTLTLLNAGVWQSAGEMLPLPGYSEKRNAADLNMATLLSLYGLVNQFRMMFA